jgi:hypothetical protein
LAENNIGKKQRDQIDRMCLGFAVRPQVEICFGRTCKIIIQELEIGNILAKGSLVAYFSKIISNLLASCFMAGFRLPEAVKSIYMRFTGISGKNPQKLLLFKYRVVL